MMDLPATLEPVEGLSSQETNDMVGLEDGPVWGRLLPLAKGFPIVELRNSSYSFGRGGIGDVDYSFDNTMIRCHKNFTAYSKVHFKLMREDNPVAHTIIEDLSSNGTFLNTQKLGRNKRAVLKTNDEIGMAVPTGRVYVYVENVANEYEGAPAALQEQFIVSRQLGKGAMGEVRLAYAKESWIRVAVKIVAKSRLIYPGGASVDMSKEVAREIDILRSVKHPCVVGVHDIFDSVDKAFIVMELIDGGELFRRIVSSPNGRLKENVAKLLFYQMLVAVKYLHDMGITHRDLKPENILLTSEEPECLVKVTDFGLSKFVDSSSMLKTLCGTPNYLAPEILQSAGTGAYTQAVDMWSLGVILFVMLSGYMPFSVDYPDMELKDQILTARFAMFKQRWANVSIEAFDLIKRLLTVNPAARVTAEQGLQHPWMQDEEMRRKARQLMYPRSDGMIPPQSVAKKRTADEENGNWCDEPDSTMMTTKKACFSTD